MDRKHFVTIAWAESPGAEHVITIGSVEAHEVLLRLLTTLSGIPISASASDAQTLPRDLKVVVTLKQ